MADEVHELAVKLSPKGAQETQEALNETSETFEETADTAEVESDRLDEFADKWKGAMLAITAGLATAAAGLLAKVPVVQESMMGLEAVIDALALAIDEDLRPALGGFNRELFGLASDIAEADSASEAWLLTLSGLTDALLDLAGPEFVINVALSLPGGVFAGFATLFLTKIDDLQSAWDSFVFHLKGAFAGAVQSLKEKINEIIRAWNSLPFTGTVSTLDIGGDVGGVAPGGFTRGSQGPGTRGPTGNKTQTTTGNADVQRQLQRSLELIANSRARFEVNLDGRKIAETTRPLLGENTLDRGRSG